MAVFAALIIYKIYSLKVSLPEVVKTPPTNELFALPKTLVTSTELDIRPVKNLITKVSFKRASGFDLAAEGLDISSGKMIVNSK